MRQVLFRVVLVLGAQLAAVAAVWSGPDRPTEFTNMNSVVNTRHNMTQRSKTGADLLSGGPNAGGAGQMDTSRNDYGQVCVYCHTPHGSNNTIAAPLWNRAIPNTTYTTYNLLGTGASQSYSQPGGSSLVCLSCHDGQQAVDAVMNMPGAGKYNSNPNFSFLETWQPSGSSTGAHLGLKSTECLVCHNPTGFGAIIAPTATDFTVFAIGTDLRDDHPVGVTYPTTNGSGTDWKTPSGSVAKPGGTTLFFDENGDGRMQKGEIRLYDTGQGAEVECGSCHDPHGVPSAGIGTAFLPSFLRKTNSGSAVCLTCHSK